MYGSNPPPPPQGCGLGNPTDGLHDPPLERINWNPVLGAVQLPLSKGISYTAILKGIWVGGGDVVGGLAGPPA